MAEAPSGGAPPAHGVARAAAAAAALLQLHGSLLRAGAAAAPDAGAGGGSGGSSPGLTGGSLAAALQAAAAASGGQDQLRQYAAAGAARARLLGGEPVGGSASPGGSPTSARASTGAYGARLSSSLGSPPAGAGAGAACTLAAPHGGGAGGGGTAAADGEPALVRELGVSLASIGRLFTADGRLDFDQPVWMVVNLQGKIKGSYTAEKMLEFSKRGTLSARQLVLGIDRDLPYVLRQDLGFYRPLGRLAQEVHAGGRYVPLSAARARAAPAWAPVVPPGTAADEEALAAAAGRLAISGGGDGPGAPAGGGGGGGGAASNAALRVSLQRLFTPAGPGGRRQPMWLYVNHLGWCRGPFSGGKLMHAHLCGRLPRDTLIVGYDPGVPVFMLSGEVSAWFRPLGALLDNVAQGYMYDCVTWPTLMEHAGNTPSSGAPWQPLIWPSNGTPPPLASLDQLAPPGPSAGRAARSGGGPAAAEAAMAQQQQQQQQQQQLVQRTHLQPMQQQQQYHQHAVRAASFEGQGQHKQRQQQQQQQQQQQLYHGQQLQLQRAQQEQRQQQHQSAQQNQYVQAAQVLADPFAAGMWPFDQQQLLLARQLDLPQLAAQQQGQQQLQHCAPQAQYVLAGAAPALQQQPQPQPLQLIAPPATYGLGALAAPQQLPAPFPYTIEPAVPAPTPSVGASAAPGLQIVSTGGFPMALQGSRFAVLEQAPLQFMQSVAGAGYLLGPAAAAAAPPQQGQRPFHGAPAAADGAGWFGGVTQQ